MKTPPTTNDVQPNKPDVRTIYDVGYRKPPKSSYFKSGVSGNPKGREKGSKNKFSKQRLFELVLEEASREVKVREDGETLIMSAGQAMFHDLLRLGREGNVRAAQLVITAVRMAEAEDAAEREADYLYAKKYKQHWAEFQMHYPGRLRSVPDHRDIELDERHRVAIFNGPRNEEEEKECEADAFERLANPNGYEGGKRDDTLRKYHSNMAQSEENIVGNVDAEACVPPQDRSLSARSESMVEGAPSPAPDDAHADAVKMQDAEFGREDEAVQIDADLPGEVVAAKKPALSIATPELRNDVVSEIETPDMHHKMAHHGDDVNSEQEMEPRVPPPEISEKAPTDDPYWDERLPRTMH